MDSDEDAERAFKNGDTGRDEGIELEKVCDADQRRGRGPWRRGRAGSTSGVAARIGSRGVVVGDGGSEVTALAERVGDALEASGRTVGVVESLTGGLLVQALARVEGSGSWLRGGIVAYATSVKRELLEITAQSVVSRQAAEQLAAGGRVRLGASVAVAVTGVAGPGPQDGEPPGTVWIGVDDGSAVTAELLQVDGRPEDICAQTVRAALFGLLGALER